MTENNKKNMLISGDSPENLKRINESAGQSDKNKKYKFTGCFTQCSSKAPNGRIIKNRNNRIYFDEEVLRHLGYLRDQIKENGFLPGELDHPEDRFEVKLKEASHKITDLWYDPKTQRIMGTLELLDTDNGRIAKTLVDEGLNLAVSSRSAGSVRPDSSVEIDMMYTWDIVLTPGFEEAHLQRVYENLAPKSKTAARFLNESMISTENKKDVRELPTEAKIPREIFEAVKKDVNVEELSKRLNEEEKKNPEQTEELPKNSEKLEDKENENGLPEANINPLAEDDSNNDDASDNNSEKNKNNDSDESSDDKKSSDENNSNNKSGDDENNDENKEKLSELTDEEKEERRSWIISIVAKSEDDSNDLTDEEKEENRDDIVDIKTEKETGTKEDDKSSDDDDKDKEDTNESEETDENKTDECDSSDAEELDPREMKTKECTPDEKKGEEKVLNDCDKQCEEIKKKTEDDMKHVQALLDKAKKRKEVKENIIKHYPFSQLLNEKNFGAFAALSIKDKNTVQNFILQNEIFEANAINENWKTPLLVEKRSLMNWLRLASEENKRLFAAQPQEIQEAIEEQAKYTPMITQKDVDAFWDKVGLSRVHAQRMLAESIKNRYAVQEKKDAANSKINAMNCNELGYSMDYFQFLEDNYN